MCQEFKLPSKGGGNQKGPKDGEFIRATLDGRGLMSVEDPKEESCLVLISVRGNLHCNEVYILSLLQRALEQHNEVTALIVDTP
jgi:hypothetical protein